jgi:hypothetical protein
VLEDHKLGGSINAITLTLLPVIFVIALGWFAGFRKYLKRQDAHVLATFVVRFALPIALFVGVLQATPKELENLRFKAVFSRVAAAELILIGTLPSATAGAMSLPTLRNNSTKIYQPKDGSSRYRDIIHSSVSWPAISNAATA